MKRIVVLLSAILLIFAVACSGDNPAPSGGNAGTNVPGGENVPPVIDGNLPSGLFSVITLISGGDWADQQTVTWSEETVREYYSASDELVLKTISISSRDASNPTDEHSTSTTIEVDGYEYLKKGSSIMVYAAGEYGDLSSINSVMIDDTTYDSSNGEVFDAVCAEVRELYSRIDYTVHHYHSTETGNYMIANEEIGCVNSIVQDMTFDGMDQGTSGSAGTGTVEQSYKLDESYEGVQDFSMYMIYTDSTSDMPTSCVIQIRGGQYDGTYSVDMSMGM